MEDFIEAIKKGLKATDQPILFGSTSADEELVRACVSFLKHKGYRVKPPVKYSVAGINKSDDLMNYFYGRLLTEHKNFMSVYENSSRDRKIAKEFIRTRMEASGINEKEALKECAEIIKIVLDNLDEFKFTFEINFSVFGQAKFGWVTQKAIEIMNKKHKITEGEEHKKTIDAVIENAKKEETFGYSDLDALLEKLGEEENGR